VSSECYKVSLGFVKFHVKQVHFDIGSKSSAVILNFQISRGSAATQLR